LRLLRTLVTSRATSAALRNSLLSGQCASQQ